MSLPLIWPGTYFFYPIGNTSAVSLTRDLAPETPAIILHLGCGDPRNVLYTVFSEARTARRTLDFTCNDSDPAILARNIVLLTMIADGQPIQTIWNVFYHMKLDELSWRSLIVHCDKLLAIGSTLNDWRASIYGAYIRFSTPFTYAEVRRHWSLYSTMHALPRHELETLVREHVTRVMHVSGATSNDAPLEGTSARSAGPFAHAASKVMAKKYKSYWENGTVFDERSQIQGADMVNPMFVYSLGGVRNSVQMGLDPLTGFHYADLYGNAVREVTSADVTAHALREFGDWASAFADAVRPDSGRPAPVVRFLLGEATAVCRALRIVAATGQTKTDIPVAHFQSAVLELAEEYAAGASESAPMEFHIIDTSNLDDHMGLLNCLVTSLPLLSTIPEATIYTESLLFRTADASTELKRRLHADIATMALLIGIAPIDFLSSFSSRSNVHELRAQQDTKKAQSQYHQVTTWKRPTSCDPRSTAQRAWRQPIHFDPHTLGELLLKIYNTMFEQESPAIYMERNRDAPEHIASMQCMLIYYNRESFVFFLDLVRNALGTPPDKWGAAMDWFTYCLMQQRASPHDMARRHELQTLMYHFGVYSLGGYYDVQRSPPTGLLAARLRAWRAIPPVLRLVFTIPRAFLTLALGNPVTERESERGKGALQRQTFGLQCHVGARKGHIFTAVQMVFGAFQSTGTPADPVFTLRPDPEGWRGSSPLIASFLVPVRLLETMDANEAQVRLTTRVDEVGGMQMPPVYLGDIWKANSPVKVFPASSQPLPAMPQYAGKRSAAATIDVGDGLGPVMLSRKIRLRNTDAPSNATVVTQSSPCILAATVSATLDPHDLAFPFPIMGEVHAVTHEPDDIVKITAPVAGPFTSGGLQLDPFPLIGTDGRLTPWNLHRLELDRLPLVRKTSCHDWLKTHLRFSLSSRERASRAEQTADPFTRLKISLNDILLAFANADDVHSVFAIHQSDEDMPHWVLFAKDIHFDLQCHTVVLGAYALSVQGSEHPVQELQDFMGEKTTVHLPCDAETTKMWQHALPAFAERCRIWSHTPNCERSNGQSSATFCGCGRGQATALPEAYAPFAPFVTQVALSPLFGVSYVEPILRGRQCSSCGKKGNLRLCARCKKVKYCGGSARSAIGRCTKRTAKRPCAKQSTRAHPSTCCASAQHGSFVPTYESTTSLISLA
ncbi:uncharacterized protein SCHCODRAFT_01096915 [Schizophyllum commune H4-8]|uniref:DUF4470 domain-containing protein n=1 Tax=Schizophyllum commune (strain H4-8 / FGSC 9210) TaxID=578458 RepID=D8Q6U3_SCHCM|nr:uncharacterized protein SCHCODRAFT_01096915 [Schizophyllum commune H4-8]KAI5891769.1 hypothetical protein SCHCODRAFT_01096915 [Schizophyllum commune H4-8]